MAQLVKVLGVTSDDPSSIPRTHLGEGENRLPQLVLEGRRK